MTDNTKAITSATAATPPGSGEPSRRETIITQMHAAAQELRQRGLEVRALPAGSDNTGCRSALTQLAVTNPAAPGQGRVLLTRDLQTLTVKATWESRHHLTDDPAIQHLTDSIVHVLNQPNHSPEKADHQ